jgi:CrcB protein
VNPLVFAGLAGAGGIGAALRFALDGLVKARIHLPYPVGTTLINTLGSLLLGFLVGLGTQFYPSPVETIAGAGFCGGFTTFSTASVETVRLCQQRRFLAAFGNGIGMLILSVAAVFLGLWLGGLAG